MEPRIELDIPMKFGAEARIVLRLRDKALVGSRNHFVRFDLYTTYAPSHPERHLGYWDIALHTIKQERVEFLFRDGRLHEKEISGVVDSVKHGKAGWNLVGTAPSMFPCRSMPGGLPYKENRGPGTLYFGIPEWTCRLSAS